LYVGRARRALGNPPVLAMTATAPPRVRDDILQRVRVDGDAHAGVAIVATDITRPNLYFEAIPAANQDEKLQALLSVCLAEPESGIVYVSSRARAESLADLLRQQGIEADFYHAGIANPGERSARQDAFMSGRMRVMVATIAFGMGIDKADIRFIVHFDLPSSLESYYQEAGRAGRDGLPARCVLIHSPSDRATLTRRMNGDRLTIDDLRRVYAAVRGQLGGERIGRVPIGALVERGVRDGETRARVALSLLEEAGQLLRHEDVARTVSVRCLAEPPSMGESDPPGLGALCAAVGLTRGAQATFEPLALARQAGLDPATLEGDLWRWEAARHLKVRTTGRDLLLEILPPEPNAAERVNRLLDAYAAVQVQRIDEVAAYARARRCRHGHISAYLMGEGGKRCASCDNCVPDHPLRRYAERAAPGEAEGAQALLQALAEGGHGWGRASLTRILRADPQAPERGRQSAQWGALSHRSAVAIGKMIDRLVAAGLLRERSLDHGGVYVEITQKGERALTDRALLESVAEPPRRRSASAPRTVQGDAAPHTAAEEQELYERLREWRNETAQEEQVPAYVVLSNATLRALAAMRPRTQEELLEVPGIGPKRAEGRGAALLRLIGEFADS
jgi:ATP-dependent DNA helicase RecQ